MEKPYTDRSWHSADGLTLHFRDYEGDAARPSVLCLHGLTRNARDFESLAPHLARLGWRVIVPEMRGRGESEYANDSASYALPNYIEDVKALLEQEGVDRFVAIGTSMGGLITMGLAAQSPDRIAAAVLNDVGPVVEAEGLDRIRAYIGQGKSYPTWVHAARALEEVHAQSHPQFALEDWLTMAKRTLTLCSNGRIAFDYDMKIAEPILADAADAAVPQVDLWPAVQALSGRPVLLVRGAQSEVLSPATLAGMEAAIDGARSITVEATGHAPTLDEPIVRDAIDQLLAEVA